MAQAQTLFLEKLLDGIHNARSTVERRVYLGRDMTGAAARGVSALTVANFRLSENSPPDADGYCVLPNTSGLVSSTEEVGSFHKTSVYTATGLSFVVPVAGTFDTLLLVACDTATGTKRLLGYRTLPEPVVVGSAGQTFGFDWSFGMKGQSAA